MNHACEMEDESSLKEKIVPQVIMISYSGEKLVKGERGNLKNEKLQNENFVDILIVDHLSLYNSNEE